MKLLIISREIPPHGGGAGIVALNYCKALSRKGVEVTILTTEPKQGLFDGFNNIRLITIPASRGVWVFSMFKKLSELSMGEFDQVILNDVAATFIAGIYFNKLILGKSSLVLHGSEPENIYNNPSFIHKVILYPYFYKRVVALSNKIIAVSHYMKEKFLHETNFQDDEKILVIHSGIDIPKYETGITSNKNILLTVARIEEGKGFVNMWSVIEPMLFADSSLQWVIVGEGSFFKDFYNIVSKSPVSSQVSMKGYVENYKLSTYYLQADLFILLSNYKESFGLVYIEAQAYGCPVVGYNRYGVKETILNKKTGFLVDDAKELIKIVSEKKYLELKQSDIISNAQKFSHNNMYKQFTEAFKNEK